MTKTIMKKKSTDPLYVQLLYAFSANIKLYAAWHLKIVDFKYND